MRNSDRVVWPKAPRTKLEAVTEQRDDAVLIIRALVEPECCLTELNRRKRVCEMRLSGRAGECDFAVRWTKDGSPKLSAATRILLREWLDRK